jgi:hypothetical protein
MGAKKALKWTHLAGTIWFVTCVGCMLIMALSKFKYGTDQFWRYSLVVYLMFISLYLFAFVQGISSSQRLQAEHPLTSSDYYMGFYFSAPLLGGLAGATAPLLGGLESAIRMLQEGDVRTFLLGLTWGTMGTTLCVWVIMDPLMGLIEMFLPTSRKNRLRRLAAAEAESRIRQEKRDHLLAEAFAREEQERQRWQERLRPHAERLATLSTSKALPADQAEREALRLGALAWKLGGLTCMRQLRDMTLQIVEARQGPNETVDYVSYWWDGIGKWRRPSLG